MQAVPERWRFSFDNDAVSLYGLSWREAVQVFRDTEAGDLAAQSNGECISLEFNAAHAAVLYMGQDRIILRPYFVNEPAAAQDLGPFFCRCCGIQLGHGDEYLARFLLSRTEGMRLFAAVLAGPSLPAELPQPQPSGPWLPGFEEAFAVRAVGRALEWRPLPSRENERAERGATADRTRSAALRGI
jgi:hypothetical protein